MTERSEDAIAERLRAFVRGYVRKDAARYEWGNARRLAEHLGVDPGWVTIYTDDPPTAHATIDRAFAICDFYQVTLEAFRRPDPPTGAPTSTREQDEAAAVARAYLEMSDEGNNILD